MAYLLSFATSAEVLRLQRLPDVFDLSARLLADPSLPVPGAHKVGWDPDTWFFYAPMLYPITRKPLIGAPCLNHAFKSCRPSDIEGEKNHDPFSLMTIEALKLVAEFSREELITFEELKGSNPQSVPLVQKMYSDRVADFMQEQNAEDARRDAGKLAYPLEAIARVRSFHMAQKATDQSGYTHEDRAEMLQVSKDCLLKGVDFTKQEKRLKGLSEVTYEMLLVTIDGMAHIGRWIKMF